jgi:hypothetical protein
MGVQDESGRRRIGTILLGAAEMVVAVGLGLALMSPAQAQFWSPFGAPRRPPAGIQQQQPQYQQQPQQQQQYNPFGGFFAPQELRPAAPPDNSHAPSPQARRTDTPPTTSVVIMGDAMADWLGYGLEDAFSERPEIGIVRKHRTNSGLIRYDPKRDVDWAQTAREIIAAEKPKFIVMMIGVNDHQAIRERAPPPKAAAPAAPGKPGAAPGPQPTGETTPAPTEDVAIPDAENPDQTPLIAAEPGRNAGATGPFEFHTEQWEAAYIKRIDATIAALKSGGVPVLWVGLPAQRGPKATSDASYLNELYRGRAEKAGIVFVDIWDGFVDEQGRYAAQGPDFEGQTRRLRSADGIYFTKAGARKLAHYVEREIDRNVASRAIPVALPSSIEPAPAGAKPGGPSARPLVGPVIPLTVSTTGAAAEELMGGARPAARPLASDPLAARVLIKGEPIAAPTGRADDFNWPRGSAATVTTEPISPSPVASASPTANPAAAAAAAAQSKTGKPPAPGTTATYQRLEVEGAPDETKPKGPRKPAPAPAPAPARPAPFANIPNIFR